MMEFLKPSERDKMWKNFRKYKGLVVTLASIVYAEKLNLNISDGYATFEMDEMNKSLQISADVKYAIAPNVSLGVNLGYRLAKIDELKATKDVPEIYVKKGDVIKDANGKTIPADYSGLTIGVGLTFKF